MTLPPSLRRRLGVAALPLALVAPVLAVPALTPVPAVAGPALLRAVAPPSLTALEVERKATPVGIDVDRPRFSWVVQSAERGVTQESYRIRVATEAEGLSGTLAWDSGVVASDEVYVELDGPALEAATGYVWSVDVVTSVGTASATSSFRTGLMDDGDWGDSEWIGNARGDQPMTFAGTPWIWTPESGAPVAPGEPRAFRRTLTSPAGRSATRADVLITADDSFDLRVNGTQVGATQGAVNEWQQSHLYSVPVQPATNLIAVRTTNGAGSPAGLIARVVVHYDDGSTTEVTTDTAWKGSKTVPADWFSPTLDDGSWPAAVVQATYGSGPWGSGVRAPQTQVAPAPLLRKEFAIDGEVADATVYVAAGGYADVSLNGEPISDDVLSPGFTDYDDTVQYVGTDVTDQLEAGNNAIGLELGRGFYGMTGGNVWNWQSPPWHDEPVARAVLEVEYADGRTERVVTDDSWTIHDGPTRFDDLYGGELYDAAQVQPGYDTVGFDDAGWVPASEVDGPRGELVDQRQQPIKVIESLPATAVDEVATGVYRVTFPRVIAGWVEYTAQGPAGTTIRAQAGEKLRADGRVNFDNNGGFQSGFQTDRFVLAGTGAPETWAPQFSYKGFQYLEVTGWPGTQPPPLSAFTAQVVHTDAPRTGSFESSSATMNATHEATVDTLANNIHGIPTDTPMFEKNGWTGDAAVGAEMFLLNMDVHELFAKWMRDLHETRDAKGAPMVIAPSSGSWGEWGVAPPWHSAYVLIPWWLYQYGGDDRVLREQYDGMAAYVDLEMGRSDDGLVTSNRLADWVSPEASPAGGNAPEDSRVSGTAYLYTMLTSMSRSAEHLGKDADAARFAADAETVKAAFNDTFLDESAGFYKGSGDRGYRQTHNVLAVAFGLTPDAETEQGVVDSIAADVRAKGVHLNTGVLGTKYLLPVLTDHGYADLAHDLAVQTTYPSWGYMIEQGATSMWEHWSTDARSYGHYFLGTVDDWFYQSVGGIKASPETGYRDITIAPAVTGDLDWATTTTDTPFGPVGSDWRHDESGALHLDVTVPVGSTATVVVPAENAASVVEGGGLASEAAGVTGSTYADGALRLTVGSGQYAFRVDETLAAFGRVLDRVTAAQTRADEHRDAGDLTPADHATVTTGLDGVHGQVVTAIEAALAADETGATAALVDALDAARALRETVAGSTIDGPVRGDLGRRVDAVVAALENVVSQRYGVAVSVAPVAAPVLPGDRVTGEVTVTNAGTTPIRDLAATVVVDGWTVDTSSLTLAGLAPGDSRVLPFTATVPLGASPGPRDAEATLTWTGADTHTVTSSGRWVIVAGGVDVVSVTGAQSSPSSGTVTVRVANTGSTSVDGRVDVSTPAGWPDAVPSEPVSVPAGETVDVVVPVLVPRRVVATAHTFGASFARGSDELASGSGTLTVALETPPTSAVDHVDFGDATSENAHAVQASPSSGTSTEAGLTRRYSNSTVPGSWYSALFDVPAGAPFVLRLRETFDGATTKVFNLYVDDVLEGRYTVGRTQGGSGWLAHQLVVESPAALAQTADGTARLRFEFPPEGGGYDPSIADAWVLPTAATDDVAPLVGARVTTDLAGRNGWHRGPATVTAVASDDRPGAPAVEVGLDDGAGWTPYSAPVRVTGDGTHRVDLRARDAAGNRSVVRTLQVRIDATAPTTRATVRPDATQARAVVGLDADDATSGVAATWARVDGGAWQAVDGDLVVTGSGEHVVEHLASDVAGNDGRLQRTTFTLSEVATPVATAPPAVRGTARLGQVLTSTVGAWDATGLAFARQWLRAGRPIAGATAATYRPTAADVGRRLSVRVTAARAGLQPGTATSAPTAPVAKAVATVRTTAPAKVRAGRKARVAITVAAPGSAVTGQVRVLLDGKVVRTLRLAGGKAVTRVVVRRGAHRVVVRYLGSPTVAAASSAARTIRGR
ncbi:family 78 glycoside hydrolase catalytic domain [Nocardioides sp. C4-1]|uniref:family 78 glycoside hydrolase catalytic domain n=1 Tax=Nocardioides sp. C4-1 TaxID=3151851 RepID=UPI003262F491